MAKKPLKFNAKDPSTWIVRLDDKWDRDCDMVHFMFGKAGYRTSGTMMSIAPGVEIMVDEKTGTPLGVFILNYSARVRTELKGVKCYNGEGKQIPNEDYRNFLGEELPKVQSKIKVKKKRTVTD